MSRPVLREKNSFIYILILALSVLCSGLFYSLVPLPLSQDTSDYVAFYKPVAQNLLNGNGLRDSKGNLALRYPPGYPMLLALSFGLNRLLALPEKSLLTGVNILYLTTSAFFLYLMVKQVAGLSGALMATLGFLTYPFILWLVFQQTAELPFMVFLYAALWLFLLALLQKVRPWVLGGAGALLGWAMLIKPIAIGIPAVLILIYGIIRRDYPFGRLCRHAALLLLGVLFIVLPWELWLYGKTGSILLLSNGGLPSMLDGLTYGVALKGYRTGIHLPHDVQELMLHFQSLRPQLTSMAAVAQEFLNQLLVQPWASLKFLFLKATRVWYGTDSQRYDNFILLLQLPYLFSFLLPAWRLPRQDHDYRLAALFICSLVLYFWCMSLLVLPILRYMVPAIGLLFSLWPIILPKRLRCRFY